jgi:hypothetical protein
MRFIIGGASLLVLTLAHATPLASQGNSFEGIVTFRMEDQGETGTFTYSMKGKRLRFDTQDADMPMYMLFDVDKQVIHMVMPSQRMYMEMPIDEETSGGDAKMPDPVNTGRKDVVAGKSCEIWTMADPEERATYEMCLARDMGTFMAGASPMAGGRGASSAWQAELRKGGFFPLRVVEKKGGKSSTMLEATKIEEKKLDDSLFSVPAGMKKMEMP